MDASRSTQEQHVVVGPFRENGWPGWWIASCSCGRGVRCQSRAVAEAFLMQGDCRDYWGDD